MCASLWSSWSPTSDRCHQLSVPQVHRSTFRTRAFSVAGPTVWNSLPDHLRDPAVDSEQFRRDLKTYLFARHSKRWRFTQSHALQINIYLLTYSTKSIFFLAALCQFFVASSVQLWYFVRTCWQTQKKLSENGQVRKMTTHRWDYRRMNRCVRRRLAGETIREWTGA